MMLAHTLVTAGSVRYAPRAAAWIRETDTPRRVASTSHSTAGPPSTSTRCAPRSEALALDRGVDVGTVGRRTRVALATTIAAGVLSLSSIAPFTTAPAFAEPVASDSIEVPLSSGDTSAASTSSQKDVQSDSAPEPAAPGTPSGAPLPLSASAPLPSELKAHEKAAASASGEGGESGGSKKEKSAGRLKELNELRVELDLKELEVRQKSQELVRQEQTTAVLQEELELARRLNGILKSELDSAKEESKLSIGLCAQIGGPF